jgi:hypothetical protein
MIQPRRVALELPTSLRVGWQHINLTGIYDWRREPQPKDAFRPLRATKEKFGAAA